MRDRTFYLAYSAAMVVMAFAVIGFLAMMDITFGFSGKKWGVDRLIMHEDGDVTPIDGNSELALTDFIPVDPTQRYWIAAEVRAVSDDPSFVSAVTLGVACYDASGREIIGGIGRFRYAIALNTGVGTAWSLVDGSIGGIGTERHQFQPGTASIKVVALSKTHPPEARLEIRNLRVGAGVAIDPGGW